MGGGEGRRGNECGTGKVVWWIKKLPTKPDNWSLISGTHVVGGEKWTSCTVRQTDRQTDHTHKKKINKNVKLSN